MKNITNLFLAFITLLFYSCESSSLPNTPKENRFKRFNCEIVKKHIFSNKTNPDLFKISYDCNHLEDTMCFQIFQHAGKLIYEVIFNGSDFYDYSRPTYLYMTEQESNINHLSTKIKDSLHQEDLKYIKQKLNSFFDKNKFDSDNLTIGFSLNIHSETGGSETIAYSTKKKKVIVIAESD